MPNCLIVTASAEMFATELARLGEIRIAAKACTSAEQALLEYTDESVLFGDPNMISRILPKMPTVDWVQSSWAGVTPLLALDRRDYVLTGIKGVFGPQIAEYVIGYLLAHELKVLQRMNQQREHRWFSARSGTLTGKRLGIMGTGSIGRHIAKTARCFVAKVTGLSRSGVSTPGFDNVMPVADLHRFLADTDYLVSTLPQTARTEKLLDAAALEKLPEHAYFVNVGRANVIDEQALIHALQNKKLAGATLDVFDEEPIPAGSALWDTPNLSVTAHIAAVSHPTLIVPVFIENYHRYINAEPLRYVIDFAAGY